MPLLNFRVEDEMKAAIEAEAAKVKYRTVSDYLRELVEADLKRAAAADKRAARAAS